MQEVFENLSTLKTVLAKYTGFSVLMDKLFGLKIFLKHVWVGKIHGVEVFATHVVRI